jgi:U5 small nuclear ribonucleoprotein component
MLELKLPPQDAYYKLRHIVEEINGLLRYTDYTAKLLWPERAISTLTAVILITGF